MVLCAANFSFYFSVGIGNPYRLDLADSPWCKFAGWFVRPRAPCREYPFDAHQSQAATRMTIEDMLPACEILDSIGYYSLECWGGATFDVCMRAILLGRLDGLLQVAHIVEGVEDTDNVNAVLNGIPSSAMLTSLRPLPA